MSEDLALPLPKPYAAARQVAARYGIRLPDHVAVAVATAVLECADDEHRVTMEISPQLWDIPDAVKALDRNLHRQMAAELAEAGLLPTALPRKVVTRPGHGWEAIKVELVVPVRVPLKR